MKYSLLLSLLVFSTLASSPVFAQQLPVPSAHCLSNSPCTTSMPTATAAPSTSTIPSSTVSNQPSTSPSSAPSATSPSPSSSPCPSSQSSIASQSTTSVHAMTTHSKKHQSMNMGLLQQFIQFLLQLLQLLFQQLGIQIQLPGTTPCGSSPSPTPAPSPSPSTAPSPSATGGVSTTPGAPTISAAPNGNPTPTIFGQPTPTTQPGTTSSGFVTTSGTKLMLGGKQYKSLGFDISPLGACWSSNWSTSQMDTAFAAMPANSLVRLFAPDDSGDSASFVESIVKEADKYNIHLIIALADADTDNNCDTDDANGSSGKTAAYYTDAIKSGSNYENWVKSVVPPLANDPGVAIWEISNEPVHTGATLSSGVSTSTFQTYIDTAATYIRSFDKNHLVSIAPADLDEFGGASGAESLFKNLDVIDDHDYSWDYNNKSEISGDFTTLKTVSQSLNKPFMIDEAGVEGGSGCNGSNGLSLANRSTYLITKANDYLSTNGGGGASGGASALVIWLYTGDSSGGCAYENINTSDPIMSAVKSYAMPN